METICQNCGEHISGNFCSNCGQKKYKRIDKNYILEELQYSLFHTNKGFFYSVKKVLKNPGATAREFIDGKRVNHYKPILLAFVLSGISAFISFKVIGLSEIMKEMYASQNMNSSFTEDYIHFSTSYSSFIMLMLVPFYAILTKIAFNKWGHNYFEHVVMNAFTVSFYSIISVIFIFPIFYIFRNNPIQFGIVSFLSMFIIPIMLVWFYKGFYKDKKLGSIIARVALVFIMIILGYLILVFLIVAFFIN